MEHEVWRPLGFEGDNAQLYDALHDGVPAWMAESFWDWMRRQFVQWVQGSRYGSPGHERFRTQLLRDVERVCRISVSYTGTGPTEGMKSLRDGLTKQHAEIRVADYLLARGDATMPDRLDALLQESGSKWKVATRSGRPGLDQRVPEGVQANADAVMVSSGAAGIKLVPRGVNR